MFITSNVENFHPENFEIHKFYGVDTCFAWQKKFFVVFPYIQNINTTKLPLIVAPSEIKSFRCFNERIYILCKPCGIYKYNKDHKFTALSKTAIGIGPVFSQVYAAEKDSQNNIWLHLKNKVNKSDKQLFPLQETSDPNCTICDFTINCNNSNYALRKSLHQAEDGDNEDICIIANGRKVFKITQSDVRLIYRADQEIVDIVGIKNEDVIVGFVLVTIESIVLAYVVEEKLIFDKNFLGTEIQGICAGTNKDLDDIIWIVHSDGEKIYYSTKSISTDTFRRTKTEEKCCLAIKKYKNKLVCLSENYQLLECPIDILGFKNEDTEEFVNLHSDMLQGSEQLVEEICERAKELTELNENLIKERDKLKRINIYTHKQSIIHLPNVKVIRIANEIFLRITFGDILPRNSYVIAVLRSDQRNIFSTKLVEDSETIIDLQIDNDTLDSSLNLNIDLVTLADESRAWCLIRDYIKDPEIERTPKIDVNKKKSLEATLAVLRKLKNEDNLDMEKLSSIKKNIRRKLGNA